MKGIGMRFQDERDPEELFSHVSDPIGAGRRFHPAFVIKFLPGLSHRE